MSIQSDLVIVLNAEQYHDGTTVQVRSGFETQIDDLADRFRQTYLYSPVVTTPFRGYQFGQNVVCRPLCAGIHHSRRELILRLPTYAWNIARLVRRHRNDAVFLAYLPGAYIGIIAAIVFRIAGVKAFFRIGNDLVPEYVRRHPTPLRRSVAFLLGDLVNRLLVRVLKGYPSFFSGKSLSAREPQFHEVNSCSLRRRDISFCEVKERGPFHVYYVGRFDENKGLPFFLRAITQTSADIHFHVIGYGSPPQEARFKTEVEAAGVGDRIALHGYVPFGEELFFHLRQADVLVMPSIAEYQGKTHLEGMANGCCVIATRLPGITKIIRHMENGYLVNPGSAPEIAAAINHIVHDVGLRRKLVDGGYRTVTEGAYTVESMNDYIISKLENHGVVEVCSAVEAG